MKHGPVLSQVLDLITEEPNPLESDTCWTWHVSEPEHYEVTLKASPSGELLSEAEDDLLDEVSKNFGNLTRWQLVDLVHKLPEWKDPNGSAFPIEISGILLAQNKKPEEIRAIEEELKALNQADYFLATR